MDSTIFALASAPGPRRGGGGAAVRPGRRSGGRWRWPGPCPRPARRCCGGWRMTGAEIDHALLLWFAAPHSFTGEDVAEFHIHGGRAVREALFSALWPWARARPSPANSAAGRWKTASWT